MSDVDALSESRLIGVHPILAERIRQLAQMLETENISVIVTQGLRSWAEQNRLYQQGRTAPGLIVTHALPGHSWHNLGLAVDLAPLDHDIPNWDINHPVWKRIVKVGESLGLTSGSEFRSFPDWPHFQLTGRFPASPDDETRRIFTQAGMVALWDEAQITNV